MTVMSGTDVAAQRLKQLLIASSPLIEEYTAAVCPTCTDVCCRQKHGLYRERDIRYLRGLGEAVPERDPARPAEGPCEAMGRHGCSQPRWLRPFKCTWYFCEPLIKAMDEGPPKGMRRFSALLQEMIELYGELSGETT
ncbi:MAG TPA: hypothetical protein VF903_03095 [Nitrospirota bacterium]